MENKVVRRGDIWIVDFHGKGNLFSGQHPALIVSNYKACLNSPIIQVIPITSSKKKYLPVHVDINDDYGLNYESILLIEQLQSIEKSDLLYQVGKISFQKLQEVQKKINLQLGISNNITNIDDLREVLRMADNIKELDEYLENNDYNPEVIKEREIALKCLEHFIINHDIGNINLSLLYSKDYNAVKGRGLDVIRA